jgi:hypothetical protein
MTNEKNWEEIYESILKDITNVVEGDFFNYDKLERVTQILISNDFMEKPDLP